MLSAQHKDWIIIVTCLACIVVPPLFFSYDLLSIVLNHGYSPLLHTISAFAIQPFGWIERVGIFTVGLTLIGVGIIWFFWLARRVGMLFRVAGALLGLVGLGFMFIGAFNTDIASLGKSLHGVIHYYTLVVVLVLFPCFCIVLALSLRRRLFNRKRIALYTGITGIIGLLFIVSRIIPVLSSVPAGLAKRLVASVDLLWLVVAGSQVTRLVRVTGQLVGPEFSGKK
jgi:hypothetical membrane protein